MLLATTLHAGHAEVQLTPSIYQKQSNQGAYYTKTKLKRQVAQLTISCTPCGMAGTKVPRIKLEQAEGVHVSWPSADRQVHTTPARSAHPFTPQPPYFLSIPNYTNGVQEPRGIMQPAKGLSSNPKPPSTRPPHSSFGCLPIDLKTRQGKSTA